MRSAEHRNIKQYSLQISRLFIALAALCLPLCGCGGSSSSGSSGPTPNYTALFAPFIGTYNGVNSLDPTSSAGDFTLKLAMGTGSRYGSNEPVVVATSNHAGAFQNLGSSASEGKAYLRDATLSADGTQITTLTFIYEKTSNDSLTMTLSPTSTSGVFTGALTNTTQEPPVGIIYSLTVSRQSQ